MQTTVPLIDQAPHRIGRRDVGDALDRALRDGARRRLTYADLAHSMSLIGALQACARTDRVAYLAMIAPRQGALGWWLTRLALAVGAAGWPAHARSLLTVLPGVRVAPETVAVVEAALAVAPRDEAPECTQRRRQLQGFTSPSELMGGAR